MTTAVNLSLAELGQMIHSRQRDLKKLKTRRKKLQRKLEQFDAAIAKITGDNFRTARSGRPTIRGGNSMSLAATIAQVLERSAAPMNIADIVRRVEASGYRSSSANFRGLVNMTLVKDNRFKSAGRGLYVLRDRRDRGTAKRAEKFKTTAKKKSGETVLGQGPIAA